MPHAGCSASPPLTEVAEHRGAVSGGQHVVRVDVAVADAAVVQVGEGAGEAVRRAEEGGEGEAGRGVPATAEEGVEGRLLRH